MTVKIQRRHATGRDIERNILIGIITSDRVASSLLPMLDHKLFTMEASGIVCKWAAEYFLQFKKAPGKDLEIIYQAEKGKLNHELAHQISDFLTILSDSYIQNPPNEDYIIKQSDDYLRRRKIQQASAEAQAIIETGGTLASAEKAMEAYKRFSVERPRWQTLADKNAIANMFEHTTPLMRVDEDFARLIGPLRRGWLYAVMGPMKRGKTWWLIYHAIKAVEQRRRALFISLEMSELQMMERFLQHLGSFLDSLSDEETRTIRFPALDCRKNQDNSCVEELRVCDVSMPKGGFKPDHPYQPCSVCKGTIKHLPAIFYVLVERPKITHKLAVNLIEDIKFNLSPELLRIKCYPPYSVALDDIMRDIDILEWEQGWIPDAIFLDYADVVRPPNERVDKLDQIDDTWKKMKAIAFERDLLFTTATQGNRQSFRKELMDEADTPRDIRKIAHSDIVVALNQTRTDKLDQTTRVNVIVHRWREYYTNRVFVAMQQLAVGQPNLGGYLSFYERKTPDSTKSQ